MRRKRIKAAKKAKLAKLKELQTQMKPQDGGDRKGQDNNRLQQKETQDGDIDVHIVQGLKKVNKSLMKKDDRFKNVIGKISKIKRKADNATKMQSKVGEKEAKKRKKKSVDAVK